MSADTACELPCFWSFKPGKTTNNEIETFIYNTLKKELTIGQTPSKEDILHRSVSLTFNASYPMQSMTVYFTFKHDVLSLLHVDLSNPEEWLPQNRFEIRGLLNAISFNDVYIASHISTGSIGLTLISQDKKVTVEYDLPLKVDGNVISPLVNRPLLLCPNPELTTHLSFWLQDETMDEPFDWLATNPYIPNSSLKIYQPVKWMTGLEADEFIAHIIENPTDCVKMLSYPELRKKGYDF